MCGRTVAGLPVASRRRFDHEGCFPEDHRHAVSEAMRPFYDFSALPMANSQAQSDRTIGMLNEITQMHQDGKVMISDLLSGLVTERFAPKF